jgi:predicted dithiol-disulfide oxidoreductase (DUF899 family)
MQTNLIVMEIKFKENGSILSKHNPVVSRDEWIVARKQLLVKEKELTRLNDQLSAKRRELPWVKVDKTYIFDGPDGRVSFADLFEGRRQLIVQHFMMGPGWKEGCVGCSFTADHVAGALQHLQHHDVSFVAISRAPIAEIEAFKKRMGWKFRWVSSFESDFNYDYHVSFTRDDKAIGLVYYNYDTNVFAIEEASGNSVFYKDEKGDIFHTYSTYARGGEQQLSTYMLLDLTPGGRNETGAGGNLTDWVRHHDKYDAEGFVDNTGRFKEKNNSDSCCSSEGHQS